MTCDRHQVTVTFSPPAHLLADRESKRGTNLVAAGGRITRWFILIGGLV
jgi:hypothetical protein